MAGTSIEERCIISKLSHYHRKGGHGSAFSIRIFVGITIEREVTGVHAFSIRIFVGITIEREVTVVPSVSGSSWELPSKWRSRECLEHQDLHGNYHRNSGHGSAFSTCRLLTEITSTEIQVSGIASLPGSARKFSLIIQANYTNCLSNWVPVYHCIVSL